MKKKMKIVIPNSLETNPKDFFFFSKLRREKVIFKALFCKNKKKTFFLKKNLIYLYIIYINKIFL